MSKTLTFSKEKFLLQKIYEMENGLEVAQKSLKKALAIVM